MIPIAALWTAAAPLLRRYWWLGLALLCALGGWLARGWAGRPLAPETRALLDSLDATRGAYREATASREAAIRLLGESEAQLARQQAAQTVLAATSRALTAQHRAEARGLRAALAGAATAADSVPLLVQQVAQLDSALGAAARTDSVQRGALGAARARIDTLKATVLLYRAQRLDDSTRLDQQEDAIRGLRRAKTPCARWCPTGLVQYDVNSKQLAVGVGVRPRSWLTVGAVYRP